VTHHPHTGAGGSNDVVWGCLENLNCMLCHFTSIKSKSGIKGGLSTAVLISGKFHVYTKVVENIYHSFSRTWEESVYKAGNK
jgi:hypothetical protein